MRMQWEQLLNSERRRKTQKRSGEFRSEFERDYDRSVFSTPVRRLQDKAQVFPLEPHDAVRTRLTHSLEVSTVARDLAGKAAEWIMMQEGLPTAQAKEIPVIAATCGLLHDLGNPPFGHAGEQAISSWFRKLNPLSPDALRDFTLSFDASESAHRSQQLANDFWRFEGNAQTLRLISRLQIMEDYYGLNLTYGTLSAVCKYISASDETTTEQEKKKPGYFASENEVVTEIRAATGTGEARNPITYLVEASDDIVYSVVDIEDAVKKGVVRWSEIKKEFEQIDCPMLTGCLTASDKGSDDELNAQLFRINGIGAMVVAVIEAFKHYYEQIMCGEYHGELISDPYCEAARFVEACKNFAQKHVYTSKETLRLEVMGRQTIHGLMDIFWEGASDPKHGSSVKEFSGKIHNMMSSNYLQVYYNALEDGGLPVIYCQRQLLTDYICGMTDTFACTLHRDLTNG